MQGRQRLGHWTMSPLSSYQRNRKPIRRWFVINKDRKGRPLKTCLMCFTFRRAESRYLRKCHITSTQTGNTMTKIYIGILWHCSDFIVEPTLKSSISCPFSVRDEHCYWILGWSRDVAWASPNFSVVVLFFRYVFLPTNSFGCPLHLDWKYYFSYIFILLHRCGVYNEWISLNKNEFSACFCAS